ncbi:MAG: hypothetical protein ACRD1J_00735 [Terriglobia bacterium]
MALQQQKNAASKNDAKDVLKYSPAPEAKPPQNKSQALIAEFQERLQHTLDAFKQKAAKQIADELPQVAEGIIKRSSKELQKLTAEAGEKLKEDLRAASAGQAAEIEEKLNGLAQASIDSLKAEAKSLAETAIRDISRPLQEQIQAASENVGAALNSVHAAADEARSMLQSAADQAQASLIREYQERVAGLSASGLRDLEHKANRHVEDFEGSLEQVFNAFKAAAAGRLETELSKTTSNLIDRSAAGLQRQVDHETEKLLDRLRASGADVVQDAKRQVTGVEQASIESIRASSDAAASQAAKEASVQAQAAMCGHTESAIARVEAAGTKLDVQAGHSIEDFQKRLTELSAQALESSWHKLDAQREAFCEQVQNSARSIEDKALEEARENFSRFAADVLEKGSGELRKQTAVAAEQVKDEVKSSISALAAEARKQLLAEAQWSLHSLKETTAEQCQAQLSQIGKDFGAGSRKKFSAEFEDSLRKFRKLAQSQLDELARHRAEAPGQFYASAPAPTGRSSPAGKVLLGFAAIVPTLLFLYLVSRPVMRLRPDPPADFLTVSTGWGDRHHDAADKLARAYWDWAALHLARQYPYGTKLPQQPPFGFEVEGKDFPTGVDSDLDRLSYWNELRKLWVQPQSWTRIEVWNRE